MFRSPAAVAVWYIWLVVAVLNLADLAWQGGGHAALVVAAVIVLATGVAYVAALRPRLVADDEALTVRNPLRDTRVPWELVTGIDLGDMLRVHYGAGRVVQSWAVQSSRRSRLRAQYRAQFRDAGAARRVPGYGRTPGQLRPASAQSTGEVIAAQVNDLLEETRRRGGAAPAPGSGGSAGRRQGTADAVSGTAGGPSTAWRWTAVAALALPAVLVALTVLIR